MFFFKALFCLVVMGTAPQPTEFNLDSEVERLLESGAATQMGEDEKSGVWFLAIGEMPLEGLEERKALTLAELEAKKALAAFMTQTVSASTSYSYEEDESGSKEGFSSRMRSDIDAMLKGIRIIRREVKGDKAIAIAGFTEKSVNAAKLLADKVSRESESCVEATGEGKTFEAALDAACRNALSQAFGYSMIASDSVSESETLRSRMFSDIKGSVSAYRILEQRTEGGRHYVRIVAEINKDELKESYGAQMKSFGDPLFYLEAKNEEAKTLLTDWFVGKGFKMTGTPTNADYKIEVSTKFSKVKHPANRRAGTQLLMNLVCYDKGGVRLFSLQSDPRKAASFIGTSERQEQLTVEKAMNQIEEPLHKRIQAAVNDMVNNGRSVRLVFRGIKTKEQAEMLQALCDEIAEVPNASVATYSINEQVQTATIRFNLKGNSADFLSELKERCPDLPPTISVKQNKIIFESKDI